MAVIYQVSSVSTEQVKQARAADDGRAQWPSYGSILVGVVDSSSPSPGYPPFPSQGQSRQNRLEERALAPE